VSDKNGYQYSPEMQAKIDAAIKEAAANFRERFPEQYAQIKLLNAKEFSIGYVVSKKGKR
jgi:hypothetical protein